MKSHSTIRLRNQLLHHGPIGDILEIVSRLRANSAEETFEYRGSLQQPRSPRGIIRATPRLLAGSRISTSPASFLLIGPLLHASGLLDQLFHGVVNDLLAGAAEPLVTDHAFVVDEVNRRGAGQVPFLGDGTPSLARGRVAERPPGKVLLLHELLEG